MCELETPSRLVSLVGFESMGDGLHMDPCRWKVMIGKVLELFRKAALRASEWRDELALSEKDSIKSTTGH